jgi:hypothetical protein
LFAVQIEVLAVARNDHLNTRTTIAWAAAETAADMAKLQLHHQDLINAHRSTAQERKDKMVSAFNVALQDPPHVSSLANILYFNGLGTTTTFSNPQRQLVASRLPNAVLLRGRDTTLRSSAKSKDLVWIAKTMEDGVAFMTKPAFIPAAGCLGPQRLSAAWGLDCDAADSMHAQPGSASMSLRANTSAAVRAAGAEASESDGSNPISTPAAGASLPDDSMQVQPGKGRVTRSRSCGNTSSSAAAAAPIKRPQKGKAAAAAAKRRRR